LVASHDLRHKGRGRHPPASMPKGASISGRAHAEVHVRVQNEQRQA
jgi:hypothetical protein